MFYSGEGGSTLSLVSFCMEVGLEKRSFSAFAEYTIPTPEVAPTTAPHIGIKLFAAGSKSFDHRDMLRLTRLLQ